MTEHFDIAVIGAGPGGYVAAIRAAQLGFKTVCIDKRETWGGTCLNVGCIPSKALLYSTELLEQIATHAKDNGIDYCDLEVNLPRMMDRKNEIVKGLVEGIDYLFQKHGVVSKKGEAEFIDPHHLRINKKEEIKASHIIIATGSEPISLSALPFDERQIISSTGALSLKTIPKRLIVIGGGVIGVELASVYRRLGAQVFVIEMLDHICPSLDTSLSQSLYQSLKKQGIEFYLSSEVLTAVKQPNEVILTLKQKEGLKNLSGDIVLVAVGRVPYTNGLQLDRVSITLDKRKLIPVDSQFRTLHPHIFAIGDAIEGPMLAHRASAEGVSVVELIAGRLSPVNYLSLPNVIYTHPEVATVGLSEKEAKEAGLEILVGKSFFRGNPRARCNGDTDGFVKIIGDKKTGQLLGMHIIGAHASEIISEGMLAIQKKATLKEIGEVPQAHPTLSEAIKEAALDALEQLNNH